MKKLTSEEREITQQLRLERIREAKKRYIENHPERRKKSFNDYWKKKRAINPEKWKEEMRNKAKLYRLKNLKEYRIKEKEKARQNREKQFNLIPTKWLTMEQYNEMLLNQEGKCAICSVIFEKTHLKPVEDHNHKTGTVRGILCQSCNMHLGFIENGSKRKFKYFKEATKYLKH